MTDNQSDSLYLNAVWPFNHLLHTLYFQACVCGLVHCGYGFVNGAHFNCGSAQTKLQTDKVQVQALFEMKSNWFDLTSGISLVFKG